MSGIGAGTVVALVLPLALDTFAVSAAIGLQPLPRAQRWRVSLVFAACEGVTPAVGLLLGGPLGRALGGVADYVAIGVLLAFGLFTLLRTEDEEGAGRMGTARGAALLLLGLSVSLDETAIGFTLGLLRLPVVPILLAIGVQAFVAAQLGFSLGRRLSERFREASERLAGLALIALGLILLVRRLA